MAKNSKQTERTFASYFAEWIATYKEGAIAEISVNKYYYALDFILQTIPSLKIKDLDRRAYQNVLNEYAKTHERQTTMDFHHQVKSCIQDIFHDRLIERDPTYKAVIKGRPPVRKKKKKFLQKEELRKLISSLDLSPEISIDWFILIIAKTGLRYAEALALTPADFDWSARTLRVNKTWNYKSTQGGFKSTKTTSSERTISIDFQIVGQFQLVIKDLPANEPIFVEKFEDGSYKRQFNSTYNHFLVSECKHLGITPISLHGLRHTHASVLLAAGVSIHSISARLGHANIGVTQETYAHVLDELQRKDDEKMMGALMQLA